MLLLDISPVDPAPSDIFELKSKSDPLPSEELAPDIAVFSLDELLITDSVASFNTLIDSCCAC